MSERAWLRAVEPAPREDPAEAVRLGPLRESLGFLLRLAQLSAFRDFFAELGPLGVRPGELSVLLLIGENPGIRQGVLARRLMIKRAHMTKMMRSLERAGLVRRTVPASDRRAAELWLTERGRLRVAELREPFLAHERRPAPGLTRAEEAQLRELLRRYLGLATEERR